jgi:hypothetical protein
MDKLVKVIAVNDPNRKAGEVYEIFESQVEQFTKLGYAKVQKEK